MSFEIVDNCLQVGVLGVASLVAIVLALRHRSRSLLILALAYACFAMGTLYYTLSLAITGSVPRVFYVSEISWIASWLFYLSLQIMRTRESGKGRPGGRSSSKLPGLSLAPALCGVCVAAIVLYGQMMGPSYLICGLFAVTLGATAYLTVLRLRHADGERQVDVCLLVCILLQLSVYASSDFMPDFTHFNLYFAFDLALTACFAALLPLEARKEAGAV